MSSNKDVQPASPIATGGGGTEFEYKVDAAFLALLLVNGPAPFLGTATLDELHLQAGHLGWKTDDLLLVARSPEGERRRAAVQVKWSFAISRSNSECLETFKRAWVDFNAADRFDRSKDRLGLITPAPSQRFLRGFRALLEAARASADAADFTNRLSLAKYLPAETKEFAAIIREICQPEHAADGFDDAFLAFLTRLDFACLDLDGNSPMVALLRGLLSAHADGDRHTDDVWSDLVRFAAEGAPRAQSIVRSDLPEPLRRLFRTSSSRSAETLKRLSQMTDIVVGATRRTIADYHVARPAVAQLTLDAIEEHNIVLLVGNAGAGKSALAAEIFEELRRDRLAIAFRAVQLATSHLAETMSHQGLGLPQIDELFALHPRKIALIESAERILETGHEQRSAFLDFLQMTSRSFGWKLIITCRDYHAEVVRDALLQDMAHGIVRIPAFSDDELAAAVAAIPKLALPLTSAPLRELLRSPFILDKAARLDWAETELPDSLRLFRRKVWKQLVRREDEQTSGLPARRAHALLEIAVRRARSMLPFVACHDMFDKTAIHALERDGLLLGNPDADDSFAPGHDVLEDWAVLEWLDREYNAAEGEWRSLIARVGTAPAIRRAVRLWVAERASLESADAEVLSVVTDRDVEQHWRHDLLTGVLLSTYAEAFLRRNRAVLMADDCALLRLVLHVVRVGCRRLPDHVVPKPELAPLTLIPDGPAWPVLAEFLADPTTTATLPTAFRTSLLFIQDWSGGITDHIPYPDGSPHIASLTAQLLSLSQSLEYRTRDAVRHFLLSIVFALPKEGQRLVERLAAQTIGEPDFELAELVRGVVLNHFTGRAMARDRPDLVFQLLEWDWGVGVEDDDDEPWSRHDLDTVERAFGFPSHSNHDHFPASSFQGPWANLFAHHPAETLDVVIRLVNRACETYARSPRGFEKAKRFELHPPGGEPLMLWGNSRIYNMFRGVSGPYALQSALMALERSLLERAAAGDGSLGDDLDRILVEANNVALVAIVASVVEANPNHATRASLALFTCPALFDLDLGRSTNDRIPPTVWLGYTSDDPKDRVLVQERFDSAQLPHRRENLELLCLRLQLTDLVNEVQAIIDSHRAFLPSECTQTDDQRLWRLLLHRCDLRSFEKVESLEDGRVAFRPKDPPADIAAVVENRAPVISEMTEESYLFVWAASVFGRKQDPGYPASAWRDALRRARKFERSAVAMRGDRPAARVAVTCARDHWLELTTEERDWCLAKIETATQDTDGRRSGSVHDGSREAAAVLPLLLGLAQPDVREHLLEAVFRTLTHDDDDVQNHAASGIGRYLWPKERSLGRGLVRALLEFVKVGHIRSEREEEHQDCAAERHICRGLVRGIIEADITDLAIVHSVDYRVPPWRFIVKPLCALFQHLPGEECARAFFAHIFQQLVTEWACDPEAGPRTRRTHGIDSALEHNVESQLAEFCLKLDPAAADAVFAGIVDAVPLHADKVAGLVEKLIIAVAQHPEHRRTFWHLWQVTADALVACTHTECLRSRDSGHAELARALLLFETCWPDAMPRWEPLSGAEPRIVKLFDRLPANPEILVAFVHFLCKFGKPLLPGAVISVEAKIASDPERQGLSSNAVSSLEVLLGGLVYGGDAALRRPGEVREAVMWLLDALVDHGSSAGFRMRDDFLTPARPQLVHGT